MIIDENSPLRKLPAGLDRRSLMFLDAIRYSIEMADLSYNRLANTLYEITTAKDRNEDQPPPIYMVSAFQDAWSIVDSIFRLRCLLERAPNIKQKSPGFQSFFRQTKDVENLRHVVQHLDSEIPRLIELGISAWGALSWSTVIDAERYRVRTGTIIPGTIFTTKGYNVVNPAGRQFHTVVDYITLQASSHSLCLSEVMRSVAKLTERFTASLKPQFEGLPTAGADVTVTMDIQGRSPQAADAVESNEA